ncbi:hypothetical protein TCON_1562 [Astathelohania contejeani]|uniref:Uncharacterized protein n=1 Tax=Astathelohania contejeani TaxID=164912 RepID=A0ABQ7HYE8_9MICR|nr:hypothetical protein TCON_1562 [Thelohania contejeani]
MDFIEKLLLGKHLPKYSEEASYPSETHRKFWCAQKHCTEACKYNQAQKSMREDWEFWAFYLSEKYINPLEFVKKSRQINNELRFSLWVASAKAKELNAIYSDDISQEDSDKYLVNEILNICRNDDKECEHDIFKIYKNLDVEDNGIWIISLIRHIYNQQHSTTILTFKLMKILIEECGLNNLEKNCKKYLDSEYVDKFKAFIFVNRFIENMCTGQPDVMNYILDLIFPIRKSSFYDILNWLLTNNKEKIYKLLDDEHSIDDKDSTESHINSVSSTDSSVSSNNKNNNVDINNSDNIADNISNILIEYIIPSNHRNALRFYLLQKKFTIVESEISPKKNVKPIDQYFDVLVIQNECAKAQEDLKNELNSKIKHLEKENIELKNRNHNLHEGTKEMEAEIIDFQENLVKEIKKMLYDSKAQCEELQKENINLKEELHKLKKKIKSNKDESSSSSK